MKQTSKNVFLLMTALVVFSAMYGMNQEEKNDNIKKDEVKQKYEDKMRKKVFSYLIFNKSKDFVFENLNSEYETYFRVYFNQDFTFCNKNKSKEEMIREAFIKEGNKQLEEFLSMLKVTAKNTEEMRTIIKLMVNEANSIINHTSTEKIIGKQRTKSALSMFVLFAERRLNGKFSPEEPPFISFENGIFKILKKDDQLN